jgi:DNA polymerase (family 10)
MNNSRIADAFEQVADLLEFQGANQFRVRAYRNGARAIRDLAEPVSSIISDASRSLTDIPGIGKDLAEKCQTLVQTGHLPMLDELLQDTPKTVLELMRIPGLGPKKAAAVFYQLGIATLDDLRAACEQGRISTLKGFGPKTEQAILRGITLAAASNKRTLWALADATAQELLDYLKAGEPIEQIDIAGSYRRCCETVGDLDILTVAQDGAQIMHRLESYPGVEAVIARGDTKMSVRLDNGMQVDLRVVPAKSFGAAMQYFTGSKEHNVILRGMAKKKGLKINEYGVFRTKGDREEYIAGATEEEVYASLGLPLFPPELREARDEFAWAEAGELPRLIELSDIRGDLHMHTLATDGINTIEEMAAAARERGLSYIAITDHSKRVSMANGLDAKRLLSQWKEIDRLNKKLGKSFVVLKGVECDILEKGGMDLPDDVLAQADWVLASVHYGQHQSKEQITDRMVQAIQNPHVTAIAHPTGRLLNKRDPYEVDLDSIFREARRHGKLLELNANPQRLDLNDIFCAAAKRQGIPIVINTDAHSIEGLKVMRYGVQQARRAGLTKHDVANTRTWASLQKLIGRSARAPHHHSP